MQKGRVLIVDDDQLVRNVLLRQLVTAGYTCDTAADGRAALEKLTLDNYDVTLIDMVMPVMDGLQLLSALDELRLETVPIVLTGYTEVDRAVQAMKLGAYDFIQKPAHGDMVVKAIDRAVRHSCVVRYGKEMANLAAQWETIFDATPDMIVILDPEQRILRYNRAVAQRFGTSKDALIGRHGHEALCGGDHPLETCPFLLTSTQARYYPIEYCQRQWNGYFEATIVPLRYRGEAVWGWLHVIRDVTSQREAAERTAQSESLLRAIIQASKDAIVVFDASGCITEYNPAAQALFGPPEKQLHGAGVESLFAPEFEEMYLQYRLSAASPTADLIRTEGVRSDGGRFPVEISLSDGEANGRSFTVAAVRDITDRVRAQEALLETERKYRKLLHNLPLGVFRASECQLLMANPEMARMFGYETVDHMIGLDTSLLFDDPRQRDVLVGRLLKQGFLAREEALMRRRDGSTFSGLFTASLVRGDAAGEMLIDGSLEDITEHKHLEAQLRHAQKMESIGQLAAGIAHEINTPTQYVGDNARFLSDSFNQLLLLLARVRMVVAAADKGQLDPALLVELRKGMDECDLDYLLEEIPRAISESLDGIERVSRIVRAMKEFSHPGGDEKTPVDLNKAIESTLTVARNEYKYVADLVADLDRELPLVPCLPGDFNQVILNLVINAAHAIGAVVKERGEGKGTITVSTRLNGPWAEIRVSDTGGGIPEKIRHRIFEPFFTTKEVGKGTGQGLAIARSVVVDKHGGEIEFETETGRGTTFIVRLPLEEPQGQASEPAAAIAGATV